VTALAFGPHARLWLADFREQLFEVDTSTGRIVERIRLGLSLPTGLTVEGRTVWAIAYWQGRLLKVDS